METKKIYLDYNATTPVTHEVIKSIHSSLINDWGNPSSGHVFGSRCKASISDARLKIGNMIGRPSSEIIFTSGGTEANNMIICGIIQYFEEFRKKTKCNGKPHIITTNIEHDSVLLPIKHLAEQSLADISIVKVNPLLDFFYFSYKFFFVILILIIFINHILCACRWIQRAVLMWNTCCPTSMITLA